MKETKTIQVYPSDAIVNSTIEEYENFGWEVIGNQRCQEYDGQTYGIDGSSVKNYSTFNKLTFSREKASEWYDEVTKIEKEYYVLKDTCATYKNCKPVLREPRLKGSLAVLLGIFLYCMWIIPGVIYSIVRISKKSKYKKQYKKELAEYEAVYPAKIKDISNKMLELRESAQNVIMKKA